MRSPRFVEGWMRTASGLLFAVAFAASRAAAEPQGPAPSPPVPLRVDRYGDPLPPQAILRLGTTRFLACGRSAYAPDGASYVCGTLKHDVAVCDAATGLVRMLLPMHRWPVHRLAYSPDGAQIATADILGFHRIWDAATGELIHKFPYSTVEGCAAAFSPDGRLFAANGVGKAIYLWNLVDGKRLRTLRRAPSGIQGLAFLRDGKTIATVGREERILLFDVEGGRVSASLPLGFEPGSGFALSPQEDLAAVAARVERGKEGRIELWNLKEKRRLRTWEGFRDSVDSLAFSPDGRRLAAITEGSTIRLWEVASGRLVRVFDGGRIGLQDAAFTRDGALLTAVAVEFGCPLRRWEVETGAPLHAADSCESARGLVFSATRKDELHSWSADGAIRTWDLRGGRAAHTTAVPTENRWKMAFSPDGRTAAAEIGASKRIGSFDLELGKFKTSRGGGELGVLPSCCDPREVMELEFSRDGRFLAVQMSDGMLQVWNLARDEALRNLYGNYRHSTLMTALAPDGASVVHSTWDGGLGLYDVATGACLRKFVGARRPYLHAVAFSPDGGTLATADGATSVGFWNLRGGASLASPPRETVGGIWYDALVFAPDGRTVAAVPKTSDPDPEPVVRLFEAASGRECAALEGHVGPVLAVAYSLDGRSLASVSEDGTILVYALDGRGAAAGAAPIDVEDLWTSLEKRGLPEADARLWQAAAQPSVVEDLRKRIVGMQPTRKPQECVAELEDDRFAVRERAEQEIAAWGGAAEGALRELLADDPPAELRARAERLLQAALDPSSAVNLRAARVVAILERSEEPAARKLLLEWAAEDSAAPLVREAKKVKARWDRAAAPK